MAPRGYMRKAKNKSKRELPKIIANARKKYDGPFDAEAGDAIMEEWAKFTKKAAREFAPVDTGNLAFGDTTGGKGIHWFKKD